MYFPYKSLNCFKLHLYELTLIINSINFTLWDFSVSCLQFVPCGRSAPESSIWVQFSPVNELQGFIRRPQCSSWCWNIVTVFLCFWELRSYLPVFLCVFLAPVFFEILDLYISCISKVKTGPKGTRFHLPAFYSPGILYPPLCSYKPEGNCRRNHPCKL